MTDTIIDWSRSLELSNNKPELAVELLDMLVADLPKFKEQIQASFEQKDRSMLKHYLHKLHGACCYCGVPQLRSLVKTTEEDIQAGLELPSSTIIERLSLQITAVINAAKQYTHKEPIT
jgi:two-component system, NarL family, sensor histidine kinase BarA